MPGGVAVELNLFDSCPVLAKIYQTCMATSIDGSKVMANSHIPVYDAEFLFDVVREHKPKKAIEVGMAFGASTLSILAASDTLTLDSVDPHQSTQWQGCGIASVRSAGYEPRHTLWEDYDYNVLPHFVHVDKFDFAFIDGWHTFDHAFLDWWYVDKILNVGGIVGFDDCYMPAVEKAIRFILSHRKYSEVHAGRSVRTRYFRKDAEHAPAWDFYAEF